MAVLFVVKLKVDLFKEKIMAGCGMKKKMAKGGMSLFKGKDTKKEEMKEAKAVKSGKLTPKQYAKGEMKEEKLMKKEGRGMAKSSMQKEEATGKKLASGKMSPSQYAMKKGGSVKKGADGVATKGKTKGKFV